MKGLILVITVFCFADLSAQVSYNPAVAKQYDSVYKKLSPDFLKYAALLEKGNGYSGGLVLCTAMIDDTLNLQDLKPVDTNMRMYMNGELIYAKGKMIDNGHEKMPDLIVMIILNSLKGDTLNIEVSPGLMSEQTFRHKIFGNTVTSSYEEYYKEDNILRAHDGAPITNDLIVPATTTKFVLSDKVFTDGKTIYGYADVISKDFLFEAAPDFKYHIMKHRFHFKYYFKLKLVKNGNLIRPGSN